DDARQDLFRAGGNPQGKIQQLMQEHDVGAHTNATANNGSHPDSEFQAENLYPQIRAWLSLHGKRLQLAQARQDALDKVPVLSRAHDVFNQRIKEQEQQKQAVKEKASGLSKGEAPIDGASKKQASKDALDALKHLSQDQKAVSDLVKRIQDQTELAEIYANWGTLIVSRQRMVVYGMLRSALWILLIVLAVYMVGRLIDRYFLELTHDKRRLVTLRPVVCLPAPPVG